jgi:hypothetical protein
MRHFRDFASLAGPEYRLVSMFEDIEWRRVQPRNSCVLSTKHCF